MDYEPSAEEQIFLLQNFRLTTAFETGRPWAIVMLGEMFMEWPAERHRTILFSALLKLATLWQVLNAPEERAFILSQDSAVERTADERASMMLVQNIVNSMMEGNGNFWDLAVDADDLTIRRCVLYSMVSIGELVHASRASSVHTLAAQLPNV